MYHANLILFILIGLIGLLCSTGTITLTTNKTAIKKNSSETCGKHAVWKRCTRCQRTCDSYMTASGDYEFCFKSNPNDFPEHNCTKQCRCRLKYLRSHWGECIHPSDCDPSSLNYKPDFGI